MEPTLSNFQHPNLKDRGIGSQASVVISYLLEDAKVRCRALHDLFTNDANEGLDSVKGFNAADHYNFSDTLEILSGAIQVAHLAFPQASAGTILIQRAHEGARRIIRAAQGSDEREFYNACLETQVAFKAIEHLCLDLQKKLLPVSGNLKITMTIFPHADEDLAVTTDRPTSTQIRHTNSLKPTDWSHL